MEFLGKFTDLYKPANASVNPEDTLGFAFEVEYQNNDMKIEKDMKTFSAKDYLNEYYTTMSTENIYLMDWYSDLYANINIPEKAKLLEVGGGPTIYQLASAAYKVKNITFTDYLRDNLDEIQEWVDSNSEFWDKFIEYALQKEGKIVNDKIVRERKEEIIRALNKIEQLDIAVLNSEYENEYDIIQSNFCLESSTGDIGHYKKMLHNLSRYVRPGGILLMTALEGAVAYKVGDKYFPAIYLDEISATEYLNEVGFEVESIETIFADDAECSKYRGFLFIKAKRL